MMSENLDIKSETIKVSYETTNVESKINYASNSHINSKTLNNDTEIQSIKSEVSHMCKADLRHEMLKNSSESLNIKSEISQEAKLDIQAAILPIKNPNYVLKEAIIAVDLKSEIETVDEPFQYLEKNLSTEKLNFDVPMQDQDTMKNVICQASLSSSNHKNKLPDRDDEEKKENKQVEEEAKSSNTELLVKQIAGKEMQSSKNFGDARHERNSIKIFSNAELAESKCNLFNSLSSESGLKAVSPCFGSTVDKERVATSTSLVMQEQLSGMNESPASSVIECEQEKPKPSSSVIEGTQKAMNSSLTQSFVAGAQKQCNVCDFKGTKLQYKNHLKYHLMPCNLCDFKGRKLELRKHRKKLHSDLSFKCWSCNFCKVKHDWDHHMQDHGRKIRYIPPKNITRGPFAKSSAMLNAQPTVPLIPLSCQVSLQDKNKVPTISLIQKAIKNVPLTSLNQESDSAVLTSSVQNAMDLSLASLPQKAMQNVIDSSSATSTLQTTKDSASSISLTQKSEAEGSSLATTFTQKAMYSTAPATSLSQKDLDSAPRTLLKQKMMDSSPVTSASASLPHEVMDSALATCSSEETLNSARSFPQKMASALATFFSKQGVQEISAPSASSRRENTQEVVNKFPVTPLLTQLKKVVKCNFCSRTFKRKCETDQHIKDTHMKWENPSYFPHQGSSHNEETRPSYSPYQDCSHNTGKRPSSSPKHPRKKRKTAKYATNTSNDFPTVPNVTPLNSTGSHQFQQVLSPPESKFPNSASAATNSFARDIALETDSVKDDVPIDSASTFNSESNLEKNSSTPLHETFCHPGMPSQECKSICENSGSFATYTVPNAIFNHINGTKIMPRERWEEYMNQWRKDNWRGLYDPPVWLKPSIFLLAVAKEPDNELKRAMFVEAKQNLMMAQATSSSMTNSDYYNGRVYRLISDVQYPLAYTSNKMFQSVKEDLNIILSRLDTIDKQINRNETEVKQINQNESEEKQTNQNESKEKQTNQNESKEKKTNQNETEEKQISQNKVEEKQINHNKTEERQTNQNKTEEQTNQIKTKENQTNQK